MKSDTQPHGGGAIASKDLLGCPWCGGTPNLTEMRYANTGRIYGYKLTCNCCNFEKKMQPSGWQMGEEAEAMANAYESLVRWWNDRYQPNAERSDPAQKGKA